MRIAVLAAILITTLAGCAGGRYSGTSSRSNDTGTGITIFGDVDANVTRTR